MNRIFLIPFLGFLTSGHAQESYPKADLAVGEIVFDPTVDDSLFAERAKPVIFTKPTIEGEKAYITAYFKKKWDQKKYAKISGYVTVRFFIHKTGRAGKFRTEMMDLDLQGIPLSKKLSDELIGLTRGLGNWKPLMYEGTSYGYYTWLSLKIVKGEIKEILP